LLELLLSSFLMHHLSNVSTYSSSSDCLLCMFLLKIGCLKRFWIFFFLFLQII
jgi:hypothetical protein